jgi:hypothetical protein
MLSGYPMWEREARHFPGQPRIVTVLLVGALVWALATFAPPTTHSGQNFAPARSSPACSELARLHAHGVASGPWHAQVQAACRRAGGR